MSARQWLFLAAAGLIWTAGGCIHVSMPKKVQISRDRPEPQPLIPCDLAELPAPDPGRRPPLAVLDFQVGEKMGADVGRALADLCRDAVQDSGRFVLVDRQRIAEILGEQDFAAAMQCDNASCLVEYGKLVGAEQMMHGRVNRLGEVLVLAVGMTDVTTGKQITKSASVASIEDSTDAIPNLVCQILRNAHGDGG